MNFLGNTDEGTAHLRYTATNGSGGQVYDFPVDFVDDNPANNGDLELGIGHSWANGVSIEEAQAGDAHWQHMLHETGHALGLKHPDDNLFPSGVMPDEFDHYEYTVMSYRRVEGASGRTLSEVAPNDWPQSFMMLDIQALQYMYGADYTTNSGDTVYSWVPGSGDTFVNGAVGIDAGGDTIFATVWDGGGLDTYDLSAFSTDLVIDLSPGSSSIFAQDQLANLGMSAGEFASGNIFNALQFEGDPRSLIEVAIGGSGNDSFTGNDADNVFMGGRGNDIIDGNGGNYNQAEYDGALSDYSFTQNVDGSVTVTHPIYGIDTLIDIDGIWFQGEAAWYSIGDAVALTDAGTDGTIFNGTAGLDIFVGSDGNNTYNGGNGTEYDQVDYQGRLSDYTFTSNPDGTVTAEGFGNTDTLINIEGIWFQGEAAWYSIGDAVALTDGGTDGAIFNGTAGLDIFVGSDGNNTYNGGNGTEYDQVDYQGRLSDYTFTRNPDGTVTAEGFGNTDTLINIEGIWFQGEAAWYSIGAVVRASGNTDGADTIRGTAGPDILLGTNGDDIMEGLGGQDLFVWSEGNDTFRGGGDEYDQVDYRGSSADYDFTQNTDGSVTVTGFGNTDTLEDIDGIWFQGSAEWASIDSLI